MKWSDLLNFIKARDPKFLETMQGVPLADIQKVEKDRGIKLPQLYVDFLQTMGRHEGDSPFFMYDHYHDFDEVNSYPPDYIPSKRYFRIAKHNGNNDVAYIDIFLDLETSDGMDAVLVEDEKNYDTPISPDTVMETGSTFGEHISEWIFQRVALDKRKEDILIYINFEKFSLQEAETRMNQVVSLLESHDLKIALPQLSKFVYLDREDMSVIVEIAPASSLISIAMGRDDKERSEVVVEEIIKKIPGAEIYKDWEAKR